MFLAAPTREGLVRLMLSQNLKRGKEYRYFDIGFDGSKWTAWFYEEAEINKRQLATKVGK